MRSIKVIISGGGTGGHIFPAVAIANAQLLAESRESATLEERTRLAREIHDLIGPRPTLYVSGWTDEFWNLSEAPSPWLVMQKPIPIVKLMAALLTVSVPFVSMTV